MKGRVCERKVKRESVLWVSPLDPIWPWVGWKCTCNHALVPTQPESFQHRQSCHIVAQKNMTEHNIQTRSTNCPCPEKPLALLFTPPLPCFGDFSLSSYVWKEKNQGECLRTGPQIRKRLCLHQLKMSFFRKSLHLWKYSLNLLTRQYGNNESIFKSLMQSWLIFAGGINTGGEGAGFETDTGGLSGSAWWWASLRACPRGSCYWICCESLPGSFPAARWERVSWTFALNRW